MTTKRVSKSEWIQAALEVLEIEGIAGVRVEVLAKRLNISKSGFYWHFENRQELENALLDHWDHEITGVLASNPQVRALPPKDRLLKVAETIVDFELTRYESSFAQWALQDKNAARRVKKVMRTRLDYVRAAFRELGFSGDDLEVRARVFACYGTWEATMFRDISRKRRRNLIHSQVELLTSP